MIIMKKEAQLFARDLDADCAKSGVMLGALLGAFPCLVEPSPAYQTTSKKPSSVLKQRGNYKTDYGRYCMLAKMI